MVRGTPDHLSLKQRACHGRHRGQGSLFERALAAAKFLRAQWRWRRKLRRSTTALELLELISSAGVSWTSRNVTHPGYLVLMARMAATVATGALARDVPEAMMTRFCTGGVRASGGSGFKTASRLRKLCACWRMIWSSRRRCPKPPSSPARAHSAVCIHDGECLICPRHWRSRTHIGTIVCHRLIEDAPQPCFV